MKIYSFSPADEGLTLKPKKESDNAVIYDSLSQGSFIKLKPKELELECQKMEGEDELPDFPWLYPEGILCKKKVFNVLEPILKGCGEWNIMLLEGEPVYYFTVLKVVDILDENLTDFIEFDGVILGAKNYMFKNVDCSGFPIFRMSSLKGHYPVVTQEFVEVVKSNDFSGLKFNELGST